MGHWMRTFEERVCAVLNCEVPRQRRERFAFWSIVVAIVLFILKSLPHLAPHISKWPWFALIVGMLAGLPTLFRWVRWRLLWRLRNRLFVTYLLIGVTPIVLLSVLASIAGYALLGQFANFAVGAETAQELFQLAANNQALALHLQHRLVIGGGKPNPARRHTSGLPARHMLASVALPPELQTIRDVPELRVGIYRDGIPQNVSIPPEHMLNTISSPPAWIKTDSFYGLVIDRRKVYFRAVTREHAGGHDVTVITSLPLDAQFLTRVVSGLGRITLITPVTSKAHASTDHFAAGRSAEIKNNLPEKVSGGVLPKAENFADIAIRFPARLNAKEWRTGEPTVAFALVTSRPSFLYRRLFRDSAVVGSSIRIMLIVAAALFAGLEILAIFLASRLSRTITRSVSNLYHATREVDQGRLNYRIPVSRQDQLAALSLSFNAMSESLSRLLQEQKEKERLQGELRIAQEVQANLFPPGDVRVGQLEMHGICRPARTVSGDYYDFLVLNQGGLCIALGDISGKGISAALLMAGLHSAVRAFRFAGEETRSDCPQSTLQNGEAHVGSADVFRSPGTLLRLLNQHIYHSTQPEKYATLFLAYYDAPTRMLRYSNGGQLPPLVLRADGSVVRLDRGGTVVGLLDNMQYVEDALHLQPADILIAYSDGVTEPENEFGDFGEDRMIELVHRNRHLPLHEITQHIMQALQDWIGGEEQPDDITLVLARQN